MLFVILSSKLKQSIILDNTAKSLLLLINSIFSTTYPSYSLTPFTVDTKKVISDLCSTVNSLKREIKMLKSSQITEEQLENNLKSKDILLNEEEKNMVCDWILKRMKSEGKFLIEGEHSNYAIN